LRHCFIGSNAFVHQALDLFHDDFSTTPCCALLTSRPPSGVVVSLKDFDGRAAVDAFFVFAPDGLDSASVAEDVRGGTVDAGAFLDCARGWGRVE
jgi:hypothetical protein